VSPSSLVASSPRCLYVPLTAAKGGGKVCVIFWPRKSAFNLNECPDLTFYGLFVRGNQGRRIIETPLATIEEVKEEGKSKQLIEDYCMWFWNYR
jgi:hypothetical protein